MVNRAFWLTDTSVNADGGEQMPWGESLENCIEQRLGFIGREKTSNIYEQRSNRAEQCPRKTGQAIYTHYGWDACKGVTGYE